MLFGNTQDKDPMDPKDIRNLFIFLILAAFVYFTYDALILRPQTEALQKARHIEEIQKQAGLTPGPVSAPKPEPRDKVLSQQERVYFRNKEIAGSIALTGARMDDLSLLRFRKDFGNEEPVHLLSPDTTEAPRMIDYGWIAETPSTRVPNADSVWRVRGPAELSPEIPVTLVWDNGAGLTFEREFSIDNSYLFTIKQSVTNTSGKSVTLYPYGSVSQKGVHGDAQNPWFMHEGPIGWVGDQLVEHKYGKMRKEPAQGFEADKGWTGLTDKYWLAALFPPQNASARYNFTYKGDLKDPQNNGLYQADFTGSALTLAPGQSGSVTSHAFTGAKEVLILEDYGQRLNIPHLDLAVDFGWLWFLSKPFFYGLHYLGKWTGNMGVAIILLTIIIRSAVFPLTNTSYRSFARMKKVAPEVSALRESCAGDKPRLQQELVKLYEREGVNPMAGCFPILLQIPIFFALYKTLFVTIEIRHAPFFGWIHDLSAPDPTTLFNLFGLIEWTPPVFLHNVGIWPCIMLLIMIVQKKLNPPPQDAIQRDMANYFPFLITYMLSKFAAGLVLYWTFSALIGLIQQMIIMRANGVPIYLFGQYPGEEKLEKQVREGPAAHPLIEMAEHKAEEALFRDQNETAEIKKISPPKSAQKKKKKKK